MEYKILHSQSSSASAAEVTTATADLSAVTAAAVAAVVVEGAGDSVSVVLPSLPRDCSVVPDTNFIPGVATTTYVRREHR